ncbi:hypothetical protein SmJEL517_g03212 [Synchytrium microbalum]|uniref:Galactose oxidase-like Early set domain-containing protein n=1 Tax=Synchytrium microbalum TaxID=1806994 RepID=A0A507C936_9FUNG|nr:uncharacterized protein SmJEL517_g03212 [Synchytrium microbalum]TPX34053.1 hypothetical protein SmJEL517_g03212 [Synchytrium microbalum]
MGLSSITTIIIFISLLLNASNATDAGGKWNVVGSSQAVCIILALLPGNRLACIERPHVLPYIVNQNLLDNVTGNVETTVEVDLNSNPPLVTKTHVTSSPFCGHAAQGSDGNLVVAGGDTSQSYNIYNQNVYIADGRSDVRGYMAGCTQTPCETGSWNLHYTMGIQRWYPTLVTLSDDDVMLIGGTIDNIDLNNLQPELNNPSFEFLSGKTGLTHVQILADMYPLNTFPSCFLLPSGLVWVRAATQSVLIDPNTLAVTSPIPVLDPETVKPLGYPYTPVSVVLPMTIANNFSFTVLVCGGSARSSPSSQDANDQWASNHCYIINPDSPNANWTEIAPMPDGRVMPDAVIMPNGKIAFVNGAGFGQAGGAAGFGASSLPVHTVNIFDPITMSWSRGPNATVDRLYHSTAVLLPDGRVMTAGSEEQNWNDIATFGPGGSDLNGDELAACTLYLNCTDPFEYRMEAYTPSYLLTGTAAPVISSGPASVTHNSSFYLRLSTDATAITKAVFIRYSAVTHSTNSDQRYLEAVIVSQNTTTLEIRAPINSTMAPSGNWMIFVLNKAGVPSTAWTTLLQRGNETDVSVVINAQKAQTAGSTGTGSVVSSDSTHSQPALLIYLIIIVIVCTGTRL